MTRPCLIAYARTMSSQTATGHEKSEGLPLFPQERIFVVRFDRTTDLAAGRCAGKLEVVATTGQHRFTDLAELLEQFRKLIV
jgi:hypothetical protein